MIRAWIAKLKTFGSGCGVCLLGIALAPAFPQEHRRVIDETGRSVEVPAHPRRILSLAPNLTEALFELGLEDRIVGVTDSCDYPPAARNLPRVGSIIAPNLETIVSLRPDLILATTAGNRRETVTALERLDLAVYATDPHSLSDMIVSIRHIASLAGAEARGRQLVAQLEARLARVAQAVRGHPQPTVLFVVWFQPIITTGKHTFLDDAIKLAGGDSISSQLEEDWPHLSLEEVVRRNPDVILTARAQGMEQRIREIINQPGWRELKAVRTQRVVVLDDKAMRPSPRLVDVVEEMAHALHPEAFQ